MRQLNSTSAFLRNLYISFFLSSYFPSVKPIFLFAECAVLHKRVATFKAIQNTLMVIITILLLSRKKSTVFFAFNLQKCVCVYDVFDQSGSFVHCGCRECLCVRIHVVCTSLSLCKFMLWATLLLPFLAIF